LIFKNIALYLMTTRIGAAITQNLSGMAGFFQKHFSGTDNLRVVSIILLLLAFVLFLFLVVILYIKSLLSFIKTDISPSLHSSGGASSSRLSDDLQNEKIQENELEKELEKSRKLKLKEETQNKQKQAQHKKKQKEKLLKEKQAQQKIEQMYQKSKIMENSQNAIALKQRESRRKASADFNWKTGKIVELDEISAGITSFKYEPTYRTLDSMTGLILNMFSRNIDSGKIAQTVKVRCGDNATEEDIIQLIDSMKNFISLSNNGKFANLPDAAYLPTPEEALYNLAEGDSSYCLAMLEALMNSNIDKGHNVKMVQKRDIAFMEASNYACTFGTLASLSDKHLAVSSFELAIELSPKNVNAWSRVADMYASSSFDSKAIWAYQNVINTGDEDIYPHQVANAYMQMAKFHQAQGDMAKANSLYAQGNEYFSSIGINQDLTGKEHDIINLIESKQKEDLPETINKLLNISRQRQASYG